MLSGSPSPWQSQETSAGGGARRRALRGPGEAGRWFRLGPWGVRQPQADEGWPGWWQARGLGDSCRESPAWGVSRLSRRPRPWMVKEVPCVGLESWFPAPRLWASAEQHTVCLQRRPPDLGLGSAGSFPCPRLSWRGERGQKAGLWGCWDSLGEGPAPSAPVIPSRPRRCHPPPPACRRWAGAGGTLRLLHGPEYVFCSIEKIKGSMWLKKF